MITEAFVTARTLDEDLIDHLEKEARCENCTQLRACDIFGGELCHFNERVQWHVIDCVGNDEDLDMDYIMELEYDLI